MNTPADELDALCQAIDTMLNQTLDWSHWTLSRDQTPDDGPRWYVEVHSHSEWERGEDGRPTSHPGCAVAHTTRVWRVDSLHLAHALSATLAHVANLAPDPDAPPAPTVPAPTGGNPNYPASQEGPSHG